MFILISLFISSISCQNLINYRAAVVDYAGKYIPNEEQPFVCLSFFCYYINSYQNLQKD